MKITKKLVSLILSLALLCTYSSVAFAANSNTVSDYITIDECKIAGEKWIAANYPEDTVIASIIPIKDLDEQLNGYCINFISGAEPAGYLVLNANKNCNSYIREFSLDGYGIFTQLATRSRANTNVENVIYSTNPFEYAVKYNIGDEELFYNSDSSVMTVEEEKAVFDGATFFNPTELAIADDGGSSSKEEYYDAFFDASDLTSFTTGNNKFVIGSTGFKPYTMGDLCTGTNTGNCGPTAATNICGYYNSRGKTNILKNGSVSDTYDALVTAVGFDKDGTGDTKYYNLKSGLSSYVKGQSYSITINSYLTHSWSDFKRDFDADKLNIIFIKGNKLVDGKWTTVGHFVVGIGYRIMNDGTRYVGVYDGWNASSNRFLCFDADSVTTFNGASVVIS